MKTLYTLVLAFLLLVLAACDPTMVQGIPETIEVVVETPTVVAATIEPTETPIPTDLPSTLPTETPVVPTVDPALLAQAPEIYLYGNWAYKCESGFSVYTWTSQITVGSQVMYVTIDFERWEWDKDGEHLLAIMLEPASEEYKSASLFMSEEGVLKPGLTYFDRSPFVQDFFGDYEKFVEELNANKIVWPVLYELVRSSGEVMYLNEDPSLCPSPEVFAQPTQESEPETDPSWQFYQTGDWLYGCASDSTDIIWRSRLLVGNQEMTVEILFEEIQWKEGIIVTLPFTLYPDQETYPNTYFYMDADGAFAPELGQFNDSEFVQENFGTYEEFVSALGVTGIDWSVLHMLAEREAAELYIELGPDLCPAQPDPSLPPMPNPWGDMNA